MKADVLFLTINYCQNVTLTKGLGAGVTVGECMRMEIFIFLFFIFICLFIFDVIPHFSSYLSLFPSLLFCFFVRISYAGPFQPRLIGFGWAALRRNNRKSKIFGPKI